MVQFAGNALCDSFFGGCSSDFAALYFHASGSKRVRDDEDFHLFRSVVRNGLCRGDSPHVMGEKCS